MKPTVWLAGTFAAAVAISIGACGGNGGSSPTTPTNPGGGGGPIAATITIGADGRVTPANVTVAAGSRVTFTNSHNQVHEMSSDPHPAHTDCPEINMGNLQPGQSRQSQNLTTPRRCGFHDHLNPDAAGLHGTITVQ